MQVQILPAARSSAAERRVAPSANRAESAVYCVRACRHESQFENHLLAVRWVRGGREEVTLGDHTLTLDDDTYLLINAGRSYEVRFANAIPMQSFAVYFEHGLAEQPTTFDEHLQAHDSLVSPVLRFVERHLDLGIVEPGWYEEQLVFLLERMLRKQADNSRREAAIGLARLTTRREVVRRVALATDYIHSYYERPILLADVGEAAALSPHHLLRLFKLVHGCTPREYLQDKRARIAARLIGSTELTLEEIAHRVGFEDRSTLGRHLRRLFGMNPRQMRRHRTWLTNERRE
jgi:AraC-like DNA-binding protein